uniref:Uncharacterized protein n=1 Tax=Rhizophora mucronata TaxID=61149 RepID=A0A2P2NEQ3_RHIMU
MQLFSSFCSKLINFYPLLPSLVYYVFVISFG